MAPAAADLVIRNGTVVDGTGSPAFVADVAVVGKTISAVGPNLSVQGKVEYDAAGALVTPGWIDCHTHYDGQVTWDPLLSPSAKNGVSTLVMGNCGIGFAPCQADRRELLIKLIEALEDIPGTALYEGMSWEWETFEEYLDALDRRRLACDVAVMIGHAAVRAWVMGARANASDLPGGPKENPVLPHEIEAMAAVIRDAVAAGALGFSTSRNLYHRDLQGVLPPGSLASKEEMIAIADAVAAGGGGVLQLALDWLAYDDVGAYSNLDADKLREFQDQERNWMVEVMDRHREKITVCWNVTADNNPHSTEAAWNFRNMLQMAERVQQGPGRLLGLQTFVRPQFFLFSWHSRLSPFIISHTFSELRQRCSGDRLLEELRAPQVRHKIIEEAAFVIREVFQAMKEQKSHPAMVFVTMLLPFSFLWPWEASYEPAPEQSVEAIAKREGRRPLEVVYDLLMPGDGCSGIIMRPLHSYSLRNCEPSREMLMHPLCIPGGADAGAHCTIFTDATSPTHLLTHWVRDRERGPKLGLEFAVKRHTSDVARFFRLPDRGEIRPGQKADINVMDFERLRISEPEYVHDLPTGAPRWVQDVDGYRLTVVSGQVTFRDGKPTGVLPGGLVRNPGSDASAWRGVARAAGGLAATEENAVHGDLKDVALQNAAKGGPSALGRIARAVEEGKIAPQPQSRM